MKKVGIVMGSASDLPVVKKAIDMLVSLDVPYEVHVYSAHRTPDEASDFSSMAKEKVLACLSQQQEWQHILQVLWHQEPLFLL